MKVLVLKIKELTSVCPGRIAFSDNETPFPLFSSAEEAHERIYIIVRVYMCGAQTSSSESTHEELTLQF